MGVIITFIYRNKNHISEMKSLLGDTKLSLADVGGIEHLILEGMKEILQSDNCYSVFVEVNDDFHDQATQVNKILTQSGFELSEKTHAEMHEHSTKYSKTFNQIWFKV